MEKRSKSSVFHDRRIGEQDSSLSLEDRMFERALLDRKVDDSWTINRLEKGIQGHI
jgi:hypothetical protein